MRDWGWDALGQVFLWGCRDDKRFAVQRAGGAAAKPDLPCGKPLPISAQVYQ